MSVKLLTGRLETLEVDLILNDFSQPLNPPSEFDKENRAIFETRIGNIEKELIHAKQPLFLGENLGLAAKHILHFLPPKTKDNHQNALQQFSILFNEIVEIVKANHIHSIALRPFITLDYSTNSVILVEQMIDIFNKINIKNDLDILIMIPSVEATEKYDRIADFNEVIEKEIVQYLKNQSTIVDYEIDNTVMFSLIKDDFLITRPFDVGPIIAKPDSSFIERVNHWMYVKDMDAKDVWKKAFIDRKLFSKISAGKHPSKNTATLIALALELGLDDTLDLLARAGYTLSKSFRSDIIVMKCIENEVFSIIEIYHLQVKYGVEPIL